jgi:superfamily II DNA or RNA helicase
MPTRSVRLRPWQKRALDRFTTSTSPDFLAVATPGAGKTTFALTAAMGDLAAHPGRRLVVVAPTAHLKIQWADAAARFGLQLEPVWVSGTPLPADMHGVVVTYQQVAANPAALRGPVSGSFVILDEIHHAGDDRAWGDAVRQAFEPAARRLALSGTPFRSDTRAIPFVRYRLDEAESDFDYGYGDALRDRRVVRPVYFPRINGFMEWMAPDGAMLSASFDDALDAARSSQRLRTALSLEGEWLPAVLHQAHLQLMDLRRDQPDAGGLVIATDRDHAQGIAALLTERFRTRATVVTSDDPTASARIARFAAGTEPWIVAVRMVSEGVDIPRLRIGVYATTTTTELFFRQAVGRLVRWTGAVAKEAAYLFIPDDPRLRTWAHQLADQRRHSLRKRSEDADGEDRFAEDPAALDAQVHPDDGANQLSLFTALSAVATEGPHPVASVFEEALHDLPMDGETGGETDEYLAVELRSLPLPGGGRCPPPARGQGRPPQPQRHAGPGAGAVHRPEPPGGQWPPEPPGRHQPHRPGHPRPARTPGRPGRPLAQVALAVTPVRATPS